MLKGLDKCRHVRCGIWNILVRGKGDGVSEAEGLTRVTSVNGQ